MALLLQIVRVASVLAAVGVVSGSEVSEERPKCGGEGRQLKYLWGDALTDPQGCLGPDNTPYPSSQILRSVRKANQWGFSSRSGRSVGVIDPDLTRKALLKSYEITNVEPSGTLRTGRDYHSKESCPGNPTRLCKTRYNTTAPMYGVSLTSGQPVTIVQKFPDLLQQVVYEVCESKECDVVRGECMQTYVPYLFLVIPLGPVTLTGQDYVLVESGCVCKPKISVGASLPP